MPSAPIVRIRTRRERASVLFRMVCSLSIAWRDMARPRALPYERRPNIAWFTDPKESSDQEPHVPRMTEAVDSTPQSRSVPGRPMASARRDAGSDERGMAAKVIMPSVPGSRLMKSSRWSS